MKRLLEDITALAWTLAGTGLVLITLSGSTRRMGLIIAGVGLAINIIGLVAKMGNEE
jgi:hypothetical protein